MILISGSKSFISTAHGVFKHHPSSTILIKNLKNIFTLLVTYSIIHLYITTCIFMLSKSV